MTQEFKVDKEVGDVMYNDLLHMYKDKNDGAQYISVTTLIGKFEPEFDTEFWSRYKAIERLVDGGVFKVVKKQLLDCKKVEDSFVESLEINIEDFNSAVETILAEWKEKNQTACARGTEIHARFENLFYQRNFDVIKKFNITNDYICEKSNFDLCKYERGVFPELLMYYKSKDGVLRVAGQADIIIKDGNDIYVLDFKTNKKLDQKSYFDTKTKKNKVMLYPLNNLMDCNMVHYQLQLSTYAWMIQRLNPDFNIKLLQIIHFDHDGNENRYDLEYIPQSVELMFKYYGCKLKHEKAITSNKKINFK